MADIVVIGSANMDTVYSVRHIPAPGETIIAKSVMQNPGGKGANQAVAAGKLGGHTAFIGAVGADAAGDALRSSLQSANVETNGLKISQEPTGSAFICVADSGENSIVVYPGANACVNVDDIHACEQLIASAKVCVMQLEIPYDTVWQAVRLCHKHGVQVLLNPSPVTTIPDDVLAATDVLVPNEHEAQTLIGCDPTEDALKGYCEAKGIKRIIMTMGSTGVWNVTANSSEFYPCNKVKAVDTTGAGDCFLGALAAHIANGRSIDEAIRFAMAASAITVTRAGAQQAMPDLDEVNAAMA